MIHTNVFIHFYHAPGCFSQSFPACSESKDWLSQAEAIASQCYGINSCDLINKIGVSFEKPGKAHLALDCVPDKVDIVKSLLQEEANGVKEVYTFGVLHLTVREFGRGIFRNSLRAKLGTLVYATTNGINKTIDVQLPSVLRNHKDGRDSAWKTGNWHLGNVCWCCVTYRSVAMTTS